jgi:hypothetical protein
MGILIRKWIIFAGDVMHLGRTLIRLPAPKARPKPIIGGPWACLLDRQLRRDLYRPKRSFAGSC